MTDSLGFTWAVLHLAVLIPSFVLLQGCNVFIGAVTNDADIQCHRIIGDGDTQVSSKLLSTKDVQKWLESKFSYLRLNAEVHAEVIPFEAMFRLASQLITL